MVAYCIAYKSESNTALSLKITETALLFSITVATDCNTVMCFWVLFYDDDDDDDDGDNYNNIIPA